MVYTQTVILMIKQKLYRVFLFAVQIRDCIHLITLMEEKKLDEREIKQLNNKHLLFIFWGCLNKKNDVGTPVQDKIPSICYFVVVLWTKFLDLQWTSK